MRCDQCKHWKDSDDWEETEIGFKQCNGIKEHWIIEVPEDQKLKFTPEKLPSTFAMSSDKRELIDGTIISKEEFDRRLEQVMDQFHEYVKKEKAYTKDTSSYQSALYTAPDFFCAKFEQK